MHTLVSAFEDREAAGRAVQRLVDGGFPREDIHIEQSQDGAAGDADDAALGDRALASAEREIAVGHDALKPFVQFFSRLFGGHRHAQTYSEAVRRGHPVVVVDARDDDEAERAARILHELGAVDVDERAQQWHAEGWDPAGQPMDDEAGNGEPGYVVSESIQVRIVPVPGGSVRVFRRIASVREAAGGDEQQRKAKGPAR